MLRDQLRDQTELVLRNKENNKETKSKYYRKSEHKTHCMALVLK